MKSHNVRLTRHDKDFDVITSPVIKMATVTVLYCITVKIGFAGAPTRQCDAALAALAKTKILCTEFANCGRIDTLSSVVGRPASCRLTRTSVIVDKFQIEQIIDHNYRVALGFF